jgi:hypothetical protein
LNQPNYIVDVPSEHIIPILRLIVQHLHDEARADRSYVSALQLMNHLNAQANRPWGLLSKKQVNSLLYKWLGSVNLVEKHPKDPVWQLRR